MPLQKARWYECVCMCVYACLDMVDLMGMDNDEEVIGSPALTFPICWSHALCITWLASMEMKFNIALTRLSTTTCGDVNALRPLVLLLCTWSEHDSRHGETEIRAQQSSFSVWLFRITSADLAMSLHLLSHHKIADLTTWNLCPWKPTVQKILNWITGKQIDRAFWVVCATLHQNIWKDNAAVKLADEGARRQVWADLCELLSMLEYCLSDCLSSKNLMKSCTDDWKPCVYFVFLMSSWEVFCYKLVKRIALKHVTWTLLELHWNKV